MSLLGPTCVRFHKLRNYFSPMTKNDAGRASPPDRPSCCAFSPLLGLPTRTLVALGSLPGVISGQLRMHRRRPASSQTCLPAEMGSPPGSSFESLRGPLPGTPFWLSFWIMYGAYWEVPKGEPVRGPFCILDPPVPSPPPPSLFPFPSDGALGRRGCRPGRRLGPMAW